MSPDMKLIILAKAVYLNVYFSHTKIILFYLYFYFIFIFSAETDLKGYYF